MNLTNFKQFNFKKINLKKANNGFSLIEIMIVMGVAGILMAMGFAGIKFLGQAKVSATYTKLGELDSAIEQYRARVGEYPKELSNLITGPENRALQRRFGTALTDEDTLLDAWNKPFEYQVLGKNAVPPFDLYSTGPKGTDRIYSKISQGA